MPVTRETAKYFGDWRAQGHQLVAPTRPAKDAHIERPQISRPREIPAQLSDTSPLSIGDEPQAKRTAFPSSLTGKRNPNKCCMFIQYI